VDVVVARRYGRELEHSFMKKAKWVKIRNVQNYVDIAYATGTVDLCELYETPK